MRAHLDESLVAVDCGHEARHDVREAGEDACDEVLAFDGQPSRVFELGVGAGFGRGEDVTTTTGLVAQGDVDVAATSG